MCQSYPLTLNFKDNWFTFLDLRPYCHNIGCCPLWHKGLHMSSFFDQENSKMSSASLDHQQPISYWTPLLWELFLHLMPAHEEVNCISFKKTLFCVTSIISWAYFPFELILNGSKSLKFCGKCLSWTALSVFALPLMGVVRYSTSSVYSIQYSPVAARPVSKSGPIMK